MKVLAPASLIGSMSVPSEQPLVSVIVFCRNAATSIGRALESVLKSSYQNIEIVVQDGASTDGTPGIVQGFGEPIRLVSEPDSGPADGFRKALQRCRGEIIASCLADEELLPEAIAQAVSVLQRNPRLGALTGDAMTTDSAGAPLGRMSGAPFDVVDYLFGDYSPYFCASFFRHEALASIGMRKADVEYECFEFEIWTRLAFEYEVGYEQRVFAKYAIHEHQLSNTSAPIFRHVNARAEVIKRLFSPDGFFGANPQLYKRCLLSQYQLFYQHAITYRLDDVAADLQKRISSLDIDGGDFATRWLAEQKARRAWLAFGNAFPPELKRRVLELGLHRIVRPFFLRAAHLAQSTATPQSSVQGTGGDDRERNYAAICNEVAARYHARGQVAQALHFWQRAEPLRDVEIDSLACQAAQKHPALSAADLREIQKHWAARHADFPSMSSRRASDPHGPLKVGYHCAWWDSATARHQLLNFITKHDRSKVLPFCYSPIALPNDITREFAAVRVVGNLSDADFVSLVRADGIDVLVETTGFSPFHRYAAMARRCAPVQVSYLNHHATTAVSNVDFVLGDDISAAQEEERDFTERIYRLPGCFFCFDFRSESIPFTPAAPSVSGRPKTFGCFGSGGKINLDLIETWAEILKRTPNSRLMLRNQELSPPDNKRFMERRFARFGIAAERLVLLGGTDHKTILANYADIDISLDTWPYCGGNTIAESLWQGVPVVTLLGDRFSARYGASLLYANGCPELVARSWEEYIGIAVRLADDPERLQA